MEQFFPNKFRTAACGCLLIFTAWAAYHNSFTGPFVFDGESAIVTNPTIRHLWPLPGPLAPPLDGSPVSGRPVTNFSFAVNYAWGNLQVRSYHVVNLGIHVLAGLVLFGVLRPTLPSSLPPAGGAGESLEPSPTLVSLSAAVLWMVHPLQTESVTYVAQRSESLMGLFYLLTLYSFIRGTQAVAPRHRVAWLSFSITTCFLGMATKEVMVTAPLLVFLYDRTFVAGSFAGAWRQHRRFFLGLASSWLLLAFLMIRTGSRGGTVGFDTSISWWSYAITQGQAIVHYLRLSIWPFPLVLDYGLNWGGSPVALCADGAIVAALVGLTVIGLWRRPRLGFLGAWFFGVLAPTSSVVPVATEIIAEHRMYLPLAAVTVLAAVGLHRALGKKSLFVIPGLVLGLIFTTIDRNEVYLTAVALWSDTLTHVPGSAGAHNNLGQAFAEVRDWPAATREFEEALKLNPRLAGARNNLGAVLVSLGRLEQAVASYREALQIYPQADYVHTNLARALTKLNRLPEAVAEYQEAVRLNPDSAVGHHELGFCLERLGREDEAVTEYHEAVRLKPDYTEAHYGLANALAQRGHFPEAIAQYESTLRLEPQYADAEANLGSALLQSGRAAEAINHFETALRLKPNSVEARMNLGSALAGTGQAAAAIVHYEAALRLQPDYGAAHYNLGIILRSLGRTEEAATHFEAARRLGNPP